MSEAGAETPTGGRTRSRSHRDLVLIVVATVAFGVAAASRPGIVGLRREIAPPAGRVPGAELAGSGSAVAAVLAPASGFFRPIALNVLWLRLGALQEDGRYFEAASLAAAIAELQPKIPEVWAYQAWNMAFNISRGSPPRERFQWVLEGARLLRERGLDHNPGSATIYRHLSWFFFFKVDGVSDPTSLVYQEELARRFDGAERARRSDLLDAWRLDARFLDGLARDHLAELAEPARVLDLRVGSTHGLYWAAAGLAQPERESERWERFLLRRFEVASLHGLLDHGHVVRSPLRATFAFAPDLRFVSAVARALDDDAREFEGDEYIAGEVSEARARFRQSLVLYSTLWNRSEDALRWWGDSALAGGELTLDRFLSLQVIRSEDRVAAGRDDALLRFSQLVRGALGLALSSEPDLAAGVLAVATAFRDDWNRERPDALLPDREEILVAVLRDWRRLLEPRGDGLVDRLRRFVPGAFARAGVAGDGASDLPRPRGDHEDGARTLLPGVDTLGPRATATEDGG